jgi:hypothetical protein
VYELSREGFCVQIKEEMAAVTVYHGAETCLKFVLRNINAIHYSIHTVKCYLCVTEISRRKSKCSVSFLT